MKEKIESRFEKTRKKVFDYGVDLGADVYDFSDKHPFIYGFVIGQEVIYWSIVIYGLFHPKKELRWINKR